MSIHKNPYSSPFIYGSTVSSAAFTNREKDVAKLYNNLIQGVNTTIISPRRWGKTTHRNQGNATIQAWDPKKRE